MKFTGKMQVKRDGVLATDGFRRRHGCDAKHWRGSVPADRQLVHFRTSHRCHSPARRDHCLHSQALLHFVSFLPSIFIFS